MEIAYIWGEITGQMLAGDRWANTSVSHCKGTLLPFQFQELNHPHEGEMSHHKPIVLQPYGPKYWQVC